MSKFKPGSVSQAIPDRPPMPARPKVVRAPAEPAAKPEFAAEEEPISGALQAATGLTLLFIFFRFSFLHELIAAKLGIDLHVLMLLGGFSIFAALLTGGIAFGLTNRISMAWFAFAGFMALATAFSIWKGGSFSVLFPYLRTTLILLVLIPAVAQSSRSIVWVVNTIGAAGLVVVLLGLTVNDFRSGRLELSGAGGSIENSNDYAAFVILVMPAIAYWTMRQGTNILLKIIGLAALVLGCFLVLSTGSRGALLSMILSVLYLLKVGSGKIRAAILIGGPLVALSAIPFLPGEAASRLSTLFSSRNQTSEAVESQAQRTALLMESLRTTAQHPLVGVGPGTFQEYEAQLAAQRGQKGMWHETHNSYTQVSSECGIPALIFYLAAIFMTLKVFRRGRKSSDPNIRSVSSVLSLMLVSFSVCMFFLAQAYGFGFPVMGGIAISIDRLLKRESELADA